VTTDNVIPFTSVRASAASNSIRIGLGQRRAGMQNQHTDRPPQHLLGNGDDRAVMAVTVSGPKTPKPTWQPPSLLSAETY
jgi:hypothetical protein